MSIESYQPEVFSPREHNLLKVDNFLPSHEGNNCFIIRKLLKDVYNLNVLFCKRQQNNFLHRKYNDQLRNRIEKKRIFKALLVVRGYRPGDYLLSSSTLYMFGLSTIKDSNCLITFIS
jgi:hypothetical protein